MGYRRGGVTKESGPWMGHFNRRFSDVATAKIIRQQPPFVIGRVADRTDAHPRRKYRERVEIECGPTQWTAYDRSRYRPRLKLRWRGLPLARNFRTRECRRIHWFGGLRRSMRLSLISATPMDSKLLRLRRTTSFVPVSVTAMG